MRTLLQQRTGAPSGASPSDGLSRFVGAGAWAAMAGGSAMAASLLLDWLVVPHEQLGTEAFLTSSYLVSSGLRLLSLVLLPWALIGIYGRQSREAGAFGLWAFALAFLGATLTVGNVWAEVFVWPTLAQAAPGMMSGSVAGMSSYLVTGLNVSFPLFGLGLILFGVATFRAGVYRRWASVLLVVSIPMTIFLDPTPGKFQESIGQILLGISVAALGLHALRATPSVTGRERRSPTGQSPRRPAGDVGVPPDPPGRPNLSNLVVRQRRKGEMMHGISNVAKRHPIVTFFVSTYALAWAIESPLVFLRDSITDTQGLVLVILASNVPSVLGIVLTAIVLGRGALRRLLGRLLIWRVDPRWYLVAVLGPVALAGGAIALNALLGGPALRLGMPLLGVAVFLAFSIFPGSALGEEIGWRGYALPRLQAEGSALGASLILGPVWGLWHLPLWLTGAPGRTAGLYVAFVVSVIALSVILTWVYNSTGGSLLMVVLLHATFNLPMTLSLEALGSQAAVPLLLYWGLLVVAAIVVVIVAGPKHLSRKLKKQEERAAEPGVARPGVVKPTPA